eukprot:403368250
MNRHFCSFDEEEPSTMIDFDHFLSIQNIQSCSQYGVQKHQFHQFSNNDQISAHETYINQCFTISMSNQVDDLDHLIIPPYIQSTTQLLPTSSFDIQDIEVYSCGRQLPTNHGTHKGVPFNSPSQFAIQENKNSKLQLSLILTNQLDKSLSCMTDYASEQTCLNESTHEHSKGFQDLMQNQTQVQYDQQSPQKSAKIDSQLLQDEQITQFHGDLTKQTEGARQSLNTSDLECSDSIDQNQPRRGSTDSITSLEHFLNTQQESFLTMINDQTNKKSKVVKQTTCKRVKKDEKWKSLLRPFRSYFQQYFATEIQTSSKQKWNQDKIIKKLSDYLNILQQRILDTSHHTQHYQIRKVFAQKESILKIFLIQFTSRNKIDKIPQQIRQYYNTELLSNFWGVFNNNNDKSLNKFFNDDLVRLLWKYWSLQNLPTLINSMPDDGKKLLKNDFQKYNLQWVS